METILFVGSKVSGYFAEEVAKTRGFTYVQIDIEGCDVRKTTNEVLTAVYTGRFTVDIAVYDVDPYINEAEEIAEEIASAVKAMNARPVIYMPSFLPESEMARAFLARDIKNFIFSGSAGNLKDQLEKNITGYYDANTRKEIDEAIRKQEEAKAFIMNYHTIGIAGTQDRIGTTTQALQIVKHIQGKGHNACYIELNETKYFDMSTRDGKLRSVSFVQKYMLWEGEKLADDLISYSGIDMYTGQNGLARAQKKGYDYYVFDYGNIFERDFDRTAFLKDDIQIMVSGAKPQEFDYLHQLLSIPAFSDAGLILSFVPDEDRDSVIKLISDVKSMLPVSSARPIVFADYIPNPFIGGSPLYDKIVPVEMTEEAEKRAMEEKKGKRLSLFKRGK